MQDVEIALPLNAENKQVERAIQQAIDQTALHIMLVGTLAKYPGCLHWHLKRGKQAGTLELTFWPNHHRAWFSVQSGRTGKWIETEIDNLTTLMKYYMSS